MTPTTTGARPPGLRTAMRCAAVVGSLCVLVSAWLLLVDLRGALDRGRDFRSAAPCPAGSGTPDDRDEDCLRTVTARIDRTEREERRKTPSYWLYITGVDGTADRTRLTGSPRDHPAARAGGRVEVTYWRGQIRYVDLGAARRYTTADPRDDHKLFHAWGLALGFHGAGYLWLHLWFRYWWARPSRIPARAAPWQLGVPFTGMFVLTAVGALAPWPTDSPEEALLFTGVCALVVLVACSVAALVLRRRQRGDDTIDLTPCVPTAERHFPGTVLGAVPYAGLGGHLVAGPGRLATTPDPTGVSFRRDVPRGLTPVRVRPPYWTDPGHPGHGGRTLVLECEDDGVPVFVTTHRKNMPWVLGALRPAPSDDPPRRP